MNWKIIDSGLMSPQAIMDKDAELLDGIDHGLPILHVYEWAVPCLTYGYFIDPVRYLQMEGLVKHGLVMARRPTGGGIIFHLTDFAFSIILPASSPYFSLHTLTNYANLNQWVMEALSSYLNVSVKPQLLAATGPEKRCVRHSFCMAQPTQYDIIIGSQKWGGAAQRRTKRGLLHQGSLSIALPPLSVLQDVLKPETGVLAAMQQQTFALLPGGDPCKIKEVREQIKSLLIKKAAAL